MEPNSALGLSAAEIAVLKTLTERSLAIFETCDGPLDESEIRLKERLVQIHAELERFSLISRRP